MFCAKCRDPWEAAGCIRYYENFVTERLSPFKCQERSGLVVRGALGWSCPQPAPLASFCLVFPKSLDLPFPTAVGDVSDSSPNLSSDLGPLDLPFRSPQM